MDLSLEALLDNVTLGNLIVCLADLFGGLFKQSKDLRATLLFMLLQYRQFTLFELELLFEGLDVDVAGLVDCGSLLALLRNEDVLCF